MVASEETVGAGVEIAQHEAAAHQKRNWVRLTFDCNDRCIFCLDSDAHDGGIRDRNEVKAQILDGRKKGAQRLILSGGEPTIHPNYVDFIALGRRAGYERVQTVTNGRMFAYPDFLRRCLDAGLGEITFSIHGPNAKIHDALVGVQGAFEQEMKGLRLALADGRPIVNVDVCVNRANVRHLAPMMQMLYDEGVREFDLLQVIPFGRAFREGKETLFYDLAEMQPHLQEAFAFSRRPDLHLWLNRFPVEHLEGYEHLIQDPYKLGDEVRGRKEEYGQWIDYGRPLPCREPDRCRHCYIERLCDRLEASLGELDEQRFDVLRIDTRWEADQPEVYGGDPASDRRRLPVAGQTPRRPATVAQRVASAGVDRGWIQARSWNEAKRALEGLSAIERLELELEDWAEALSRMGEDAELDGYRVVAAHATDPAQAQALIDHPAPVEIIVALSRETALWLQGGPDDPRLSVRLPSHERLTTSADRDPDLVEVFRTLPPTMRVYDVPACITGRPPEPSRRVLDTTILTPEGKPEIFRFARRFVLDHYRVKSLRCRSCVHVEACPGLPVNFVRAHGFAMMEPVDDDPGQR